MNINRIINVGQPDDNHIKFDVNIDLTSYYNKTEINNLFNSYSDKDCINTNVYLKTALYNKTEINELFNGYYNISAIDSAFLYYYTQSRINTLLD